MHVKAHTDGGGCEISRFYALKREVTPIYADLASALSNAQWRPPPAITVVHYTPTVGSFPAHLQKYILQSSGYQCVVTTERDGSPWRAVAESDSGRAECSGGHLPFSTVPLHLWQQTLPQGHEHLLQEVRDVTRIINTINIHSAIFAWDKNHRASIGYDVWNHKLESMAICVLSPHHTLLKYFLLTTNIIMLRTVCRAKNPLILLSHLLLLSPPSLLLSLPLSHSLSPSLSLTLSV